MGAGPGGENGPLGSRAEGATGRGISVQVRDAATRGDGARAGFRPEAGRPIAPRERRSAGPGPAGRNTTEDAVAELETWLRFLSCEAVGAGEAQGLRAAGDRVKGAPRGDRAGKEGGAFPAGRTHFSGPAAAIYRCQ